MTHQVKDAASITLAVGSEAQREARLQSQEVTASSHPLPLIVPGTAEGANPSEDIPVLKQDQKLDLRPLRYKTENVPPVVNAALQLDGALGL